MKIVFFEASDAEKAKFLNTFEDNEIVFIEDKLDETNAQKAEDAGIISVFVGITVNKNVIDSMPNLKFISTRSTGFDHIDYEYAKTKGIKVSSVPGYGSHTVAEFAFGLILNLSRNILKSNNYVKETSDFNYNHGMTGFELQGKTLGVIGTGRIGKNVIKIAKGFGMKINAYDLYPDVAFSQENNFEYKSFAEVVQDSDIITLHTPYTKENHHLINKEIILKMKKGAYLINTARGELIDTEALVFGLKEKIIAGAGLDVLEKERELRAGLEGEEKIIELNQELIKMPNVVITPHIAFFTKEAVDEILESTTKNIQGFISGVPVNLIN
jgi:D-lactate dehydrogenase